MALNKPHGDIVIVGAGPAGCATALALAHQGACVLMIESDERPSQRLAGEWLHPPGVKILHQLGVDLSATGCVPGSGFVVFPDDGSPAITLPYAHGGTGLSFAHSALVQALRETVAAHPRITLSADKHVTAVDHGTVTYTDRRTQQVGQVSAEAIIGADGRSSRLRQAFTGTAGSKRLSRMVGVCMDAQLPHEGYGHIFLGGPGPILAYRLNERTVRLCVDIPLTARPTNLADYIDRRYAMALPPHLSHALAGQLNRGALTWAANQFQARLRYTQGPYALVGDAVGHFHPMTAAGLTLALMDGECLARSASWAAYERERASRSRVPEMLANALYTVFTSDGPADRALRHAVYELWRRDPIERDRTMRLLSTEETHRGQFTAAFLHVAGVAVSRLARQALVDRQVGNVFHTVRELAEWLPWLGGLTDRGWPASLPGRGR
ncbi:FAD-dependent oxidoreductase [Nonomuraea sp. NPDC005650]|uniref:FAD-dependent oxidoreductase n=1 Tax=Nonomuraea sp. NPDC005650 TaxID=3157045 RepID=UPI0033A3E18B